MWGGRGRGGWGIISYLQLTIFSIWISLHHFDHFDFAVQGAWSNELLFCMLRMFVGNGVVYWQLSILQ